jgi:hypothetical protein
MASGATPTPQMGKTWPPDRRVPGRCTPKPTNSLELGREPLNSGHNEGPPSKLGALPAP